MNRCIFCKSTAGPFKTREHILPESLGGGDWAILPGGLFCDSCQNRFGSEIEQQALADYPFNMLRTFLAIPTKRRKPPWFESWEGVLQGTGMSGQLSYAPAPWAEPAMRENRKSQLRIPMVSLKPTMICRMLLKIGLEIIAADTQDYVFDERFDCARTFALSGVKDCEWWYIQEEDHGLAKRLFHGDPVQYAEAPFHLSVVNCAGAAEAFHLRIHYLDMITPLVPSQIIDYVDSPPERRVCRV